MTTATVGTGTLRLKMTLDPYVSTVGQHVNTLHDVQLRLKAVEALLECASLIYSSAEPGSQRVEVQTQYREPAVRLIAPGAAVIESMAMQSPLVITLAALPATIVYGVTKIVDRINMTRQRYAEANAAIATAHAVEQEQQLRHDVFVLLREELASHQPDMDIASDSNPVIERIIRHVLTQTAELAPSIVAAEVLDPAVE